MTFDRGKEPPRRTIEDLIARYQLEPHLRDLFVEGPSDQAIYDWYLKNIGCPGITIFDIDSIDIDSDILQSYSLPIGSRSRVIALALLLGDSLDPRGPCVRCIADSDFDFVLGPRVQTAHLLYTDYTSVDMYLYTVHTLDKVLSLSFPIPEANIQPLITSMTRVLQEVFLARTVNQSLGWNMQFISFTGDCKIDENQVIFNKSSFVKRYLSKNNKLRDRAHFDQAYDALDLVPVSDPRMKIHSEDYLELLGWFISRKPRWRRYKERDQPVKHVLLASLDTLRLQQERLFAELATVFG